MSQSNVRSIETPIGALVLAAGAEGLTHCLLQGCPRLPAPRADVQAVPHLDAAERALDAYFAGEKDPWEGLTLMPSGTDFQCEVWRALRRIPYGTTVSYRELARAAGRPRAARAIGQANHHNPLAIIVPCHRVIAADGSLAGYAGGVERKRWLLRHEGAWPN